MRHGAENMRHCVKMCVMVPRNVRLGAKNMRHGVENVRLGTKSVRHCAKNVRHGAKNVCHDAKMCVMVQKYCVMMPKISKKTKQNKYASFQAYISNIPLDQKSPGLPEVGVWNCHRHTSRHTNRQTDIKIL